MRTGTQYDPFIEPPLAKYLSRLNHNGQPLSFYDMKEREKREKAASMSANDSPRSKQGRDSWRDSRWMPLGHKDEGGDSPPPPPRYKEKDDLLPMRLPWTMWMNTNCKNHFVASLGEFVGTAMFLFFAFSGTEVAKAKASTPADSRQVEGDPAWDPTVFIYIALCFGFSLMANVWIFFRISGGLFNPAVSRRIPHCSTDPPSEADETLINVTLQVTLALWVTRAFGAWRALCLFVAQILGAIAAAGMVLAIFPAPLNVQTTLSDGTSIAQGYMIEMLMTAELVFTYVGAPPLLGRVGLTWGFGSILMLAKEKHKATFIAPVGIGLALFVAELAGVYYTGGSLNPARSLGPALVTNTWDSHHWIYWAAPASGAVIAIAFYFLIKTLEYEMANPGQDGDEANDPTKNPSHEVRERQRAKTARILARLGMDTSQQAGGSSTPQMNEVELLGTKDAMLDVEKGVGTHPGYMASSASVGGEHDSPTRPFAARGRMSPRQSMHNEPA